jgi:Ca2+-transporting ATPase
MSASREPRPLVEPLHISVPGRARFRVNGLHRSPRHKDMLERRLAPLDEIDYVLANPVTGNILVRFRKNISHETIAALIEEALRDGARQSSLAASTSNAGGIGPDASGEQAIAARANWDNCQPLERGLAAEFAAAKSWYLLETAAVLSECSTSRETGLSQAAADERCKTRGPNRLATLTGPTNGELLLRQFNSIPVALLTASAVVSVLTGGIADAAAIIGVVAINATIGFFTERSSEDVMTALRRVIHPIASVIRDGNRKDVAAEELVVGDVLCLKAGSRVAADVRLIETEHVAIDESALTGESVPVDKTAETLRGQDLPLAERRNMAQMGTLVTTGQGLGVVVATGRSTEMGRIQKLAIAAEAPETPMQRQLAWVGRSLVAASSATCAGVFAIGFVRGYGSLEILKSSISVAVAAVPEGLPTVAAAALALGILDMRRRRVVVRKLEAIETLGCVETVCFDKTGTLTQNRMVVVSLDCGAREFTIENGAFFEGAKRFHPSELLETNLLCRIGVLCSESQVMRAGNEYAVAGSSTENALVYLAIAAGIDPIRLRSEYPIHRITRRSPNQNFMRTVPSGCVRCGSMGGAVPGRGQG